MARAADRLPENAPGDLFVDERCIDCDTCREIAPTVFARAPRGLSYVARQPDGEARRRALLALVSCPVSAIGSVARLDVRAAARGLPEPIADELPDVYYCGYAAASSYGASSYLIRRPGGNVLVDSPRAARPLLAALGSLGGVETMFLSHRDDVADHEVFARRFGCRRILHEADVAAGTRGVEQQIAGRDPVRLAEDLLAIPVPGHTRGSMALLFRDDILFTGDHLWWEPDDDGLWAERSVCWWSWSEQKESLRRLLGHRFRWVLPGHGRRVGMGSADEMRSALERLLGALR